MTTNLENILQEFFRLSYKTPGTNPIKTAVRDIKLKDFTILRKTATNYSIIFLNSGYSIDIPWGWIDLGMSLNAYCGERIIKEFSLTDDTTTDTVVNLVKAMCFLETRRFNEFLDCISNICINKTESLRTWLKENENFPLDSIKFNSPNKLMDI